MDYYVKENTHHDSHTKYFNPAIRGRYKNEYKNTFFVIDRSEFLDDDKFIRITTKLHEILNLDEDDVDYQNKFDLKIKSIPIDELIDIFQKCKERKETTRFKFTGRHQITYTFKINNAVIIDRGIKTKIDPSNLDRIFQITIRFPVENTINHNIIKRYKRYKKSDSIFFNPKDKSNWKKGNKPPFWPN